MKYFVILLCFISVFSQSQDLKYTHSILDTLCSKTMFGRGYLNNGNHLAAVFLSNEFKHIGLDSYQENYFQKFSYPVNTFPGKIEFGINQQKLILAQDYYVMAKSAGCKGTFKTVYYNKNTISNKDSLRIFQATDFSDKFIVVDKLGTDNKDTLDMFAQMRINPKKAKGIIHIEEKLSWNVSVKVEDYTDIALARSSLKSHIHEISIDVENKFIADFPTQNIVGFIKGTTQPDSFIVFTAHYDHLGGMGDSIYIPGANDNASGVSMLLNLAKYYKEYPPKCSVVFIAFSGEEAGLLGSMHFVEHPLFPLKNIKIVLNLDLVGTGDDGIMLVNGAIFTDLYNRMVDINNKKNYVSKISKRGEAKNSDHYPFYAHGVKSFFIYTLGGITEYHSLGDKAQTLPLTKYSELFHLITDYTFTFY